VHMRVKKKLLLSIIILTYLLSSYSCFKEVDTSGATTEEWAAEQRYNMLEDDENWYMCIDGITRVSKQDRAETVLLDETNAIQYQLDSEWIYYVVQKRRYNLEFSINRIRIDGTDNTLLLDESWFERAAFHSYTIVGDVLYIQMGYEFYAYSLLSKTIELIDTDVGVYQIVGNKLYFIRHAERDFTIYVKNLDTGEIETLFGGYVQNFL